MKSEELLSSSSLFIFKNIFFVVWRVNCSHTGEGELQFAHTTICPYCKIHLCFQLTIMGGRIVDIQEEANCNSPLHVCYPNVGKYTYKSCKYTKKDVMGMV